MPLCLNPGASVPVTLSTDADAPADRKPVFRARFRTVAQSVEVARLLADAGKLDGIPDWSPLHDKALALCLAGWDLWDAGGNPVPFDVAELPNLLTLGERRELLDRCMEATVVEEEKKRRSASPSLSTTASSAAVVPTPAGV